MINNIVLSPLPHTWIFDVDGTLCIHNGYKNGNDKLLKGVKSLFNKISLDDFIIILTSRHESDKEHLEHFLQQHNLRYNYIIYDVPVGERILVNDIKPSGLKTAYAINKIRDAQLSVNFSIDDNL